MSDIVSFKTRVKDEAIKYAKDYQEIMVDKEYLIFSKSFSIQPYYILKAYRNNYLHLIGVHTTLNPEEFFNKCLEGTLLESDFDFAFKDKNENEVKGTVRRKIKSISEFKNFFANVVGVEEKFGKGNISCALAGSNGRITIGYAKNKYSVPMTLLRGNELSSNVLNCDILLSKNVNETCYNCVLIGTSEELKEFLNNHKEILINQNL